MVVAKLYVLGLGLLGKEGVDVVDEADEVGLAHLHLHLSLIDFPQVHHLVDESENALGIAAHGLVEALALRFFILFDERLQGCDDERHRGAYLMTDVHEEAKLGVGHLLSMDMLLQAQLVFQLALAAAGIEPCAEGCQQQIGYPCPCGRIPGGMHLDGERADAGFLLVAHGLDAEVVGAWGHATEGNLVDARLQGYPLLVVNTIEIGDVLGIVVGEGGELQGERVVVVTEVEAGGVDDEAVGDGIDARLHAGGDGRVAHDETGEIDMGLPCLRLDIGRIEPTDAAGAAEEQHALGVDADGSVAELAALQTIIDIIAGAGELLGLEATQAVVGAHPEVALPVADDGGNAIVRESVVGGVVAVGTGAQVVAIESVVGASPHLVAGIGIDGAHEGVVVGTVDAEGGQPAVTGNVVAAEADGGGHEEALLVVRQAHLAEEVVRNAVYLAVVVGAIVHGVDAQRSAMDVEPHQSGAHGGYPHVAVGGRCQREDAHIVTAQLQVDGVPLAGDGVDPSAALIVRAQPDTAAGILGHGEDSTGAVGDVLGRRAAGIHKVESVFVGAHPDAPVAVDEGAGDAVRPDNVAVAQPVAHISEVHLGLGLHEESFVEQAYPDVAVAVFEDGHGFALGHVELVAIERIAHQLVGLGVVDHDATAVATEDEPSVACRAEGVDGQSGRFVDEEELPLLVVEAIDARAIDGGIDIALIVLPYFAEHRLMRVVVEEACVVVTLYEHDAFGLGDNPEASASVFHGKAHIPLAAAELRVSLSGGLLLIEPQDAKARCAGQHLALAVLHDVVDIGADGLAVAVYHLEVVEAGAVVGLHGIVVADEECALAALRDAVDVVAIESRPLVFLLEDAELVAVVSVESVACGHPDESVVVLEHL